MSFRPALGGSLEMTDVPYDNNQYENQDPNPFHIKNGLRLRSPFLGKSASYF